MKETDLYQPIKAYFEAEGFEVKAEIGAADVVAIRPEAPDELPTIIELKTAFNLQLLHQAVTRLALTDQVYIAVPRKKGRVAWKNMLANIRLTRRLGLGFITLEPQDMSVKVHAKPGPYAPRDNKPKRARLLKEFQNRIGDPNVGGSTKTTIITAYRQDAEKLRDFLAINGPSKPSTMSQALDIPRAQIMLATNHYGWFVRVARGLYALNPECVS